MSLKNSNRVARKMHFIRKSLQFCGFFVGNLVINKNIYLHSRLEDSFENRCHESVPIRDVMNDMMALSDIRTLSRAL
jgi:hypothetical protein